MSHVICTQINRVGTKVMDYLDCESEIVGKEQDVHANLS